MLKMPPSSAFFTCMSPAAPMSCIAASACIDTPVAPIGWPLALSPPDGLTGSGPPFSVRPSAIARAPCPSPTSPIASYSISSAMVKQSWVSTKERSDNALPGERATLELEHVALRHRQEILHVLGRAKDDRLAELERGLDVGEHDSSGAVGDERAVRALERAGDAGILLALGAAEVVAQVLADLRERIADAVPVVLGRDARERVRLVAPALEIKRGDLTEDAGEAAVDVGLFAHVGCLEQVAADLDRRRRGHLLGADHEHDARGLRGDR